MTTMAIGEAELWKLSYYRVCELTGALFLGRLARTVKDADLRVYFTEQFAEEARHAWLWTDAIRRLGASPLPIRETYQSIYGRLAGRPTRLLDILACTKVFEDRVLVYFRSELERPELHPLVAETITAILGEEEGHSDGMGHFLEQYALREGRPAVEEALARYRQLDERAFELVRPYLDRPWDALHLDL